jgi:hypothetical protein
VRTIFALFEGYAEAREAVETLRERGLDVDEMNALISAEVARGGMDVNLPPVGDGLAAGELANFVVAAAGRSGAAEGGFTAALIDFGVPGHAAEAYQRGVADGGLLFWMRTEDERAGEVREVVQEQGASRVGAYP